MSASPKETDHEAGVQSPDDPDAVMNDPHNAGLQCKYPLPVSLRDRVTCKY